MSVEVLAFTAVYVTMDTKTETNSVTNHGAATELIPLNQIDEVENESSSYNIADGGSDAEEAAVSANADIEEFIPTPPDGGWGWVIVISSFMNHFILDGISYAFGAFMLDYAEYFHSSAASTSALMSTLIGCYMLSAPIASALINKFGCRPVGILGSVLASIAFVLCTFSNSINLMIFLFGVCGGIGFGFMYMPAVISVSLYFEKKRPLAIGIGMCGTGVGTFVFGPLSKVLLQSYGWKGAHYIMAGIILNGAFFAALMRPLQTEHDRKLRIEKRIERIEKKNQHSVNGSYTIANNTDLFSTDIAGAEARKVMSSHPNIRSAGFGSKLNTDSVNIYHSTSRLGSHKVMTKLTIEEAEDLKRPLYKKDIFYSGSVYHLPEFKEAHSVQEYLTSTTSIPAMHTDTSPPTFSCNCFPRQVADTLSEMLDFNLLKDGSFVIFLILAMLVMLAYFIPFAFTNVRAEQLGIESTKAALLISILGISTMLGRLLSNLIALIPGAKALFINNAFLFVGGLCCAAIPFCMTFETMAAAAFGYGLFMGAHIALSPIILVDLVGLDKLTTAYGVITLGRGISTLTGPPVAGRLYDHFLTYNVAFYTAGSLISFSALGFFLLELPYFKKTTTDRKQMD